MPGEGARAMRLVSADELRRVADLATCIAALEEGHKGPRPELAESLIGPGAARYLIRSAHNGMSLIGSKLITILPDNPQARGLPSVQAVILLFDARSGVARVAMEATELTYWKTAADSALAARLLSRPEARILVVAGAGGLAPWLVRAHCMVRPGIERVLLWNRTAARAEHLARDLSREGFPARCVEDLRAAVCEADIVSTATMAQQPILDGDWLKPGAHVDLVGGYSPDTREADDAALRRARIFVDCLDSALHGVGDIVVPLREGVITRDDIQGDLYDLVGAGVEGRGRADEITLFKNAGGAHLDLMIADALLRRIEAAAPGHEAEAGR